MGQKIHPVGFRLSVLRNWSSKWYANSKNFPGHVAGRHQGPATFFKAEARARRRRPGIIIERPGQECQNHESTAPAPGVVIGKERRGQSSP